MIILITIALIGYIIYWATGESFLAVIGGIVSGSLIGVFISACITTQFDKTIVTEKSISIASIQDNSHTSGSFLLGSGSINEEMVYVFYKKEHGYHTLETIPTNRAKIKYTQDTPRIEYRTVQFNEPTWKRLMVIPTPLKHLKALHIIHVPEGTILNEYNLDAKL